MKTFKFMNERSQEDQARKDKMDALNQALVTLKENYELSLQMDETLAMYLQSKLEYQMKHLTQALIDVTLK